MTTEILGIDELAPSQGSPDVTHNNGLRQLEGKLVRALDKDLTVAPSTPAAGDVYIVATGATGIWSGKDKKIAHYWGGAWKYYTPIHGNSIFVTDEDKRYFYNGTSWGIEPAGSLADGDYGDFTVSSGVATIDNDAVTYAKIQNVSATDKLLGRSSSGAGDIEEITCTAAGRALIDDADATAQRATLGLVIGTNVQAYDAELAAIAGLTSAADKGIQFTGSGTAATFDLTTAGKALLDDADAAAQRTTLGLGTVATLAYDTDGTLAANSDSRVATQKAVKTYADSLIAANDAMQYKGVIDCSANPNYPAADAGHTYKVSVAGKIGGASGTNVEAGDMLICTADSTASGNQATVGTYWNIVQVNIDGAVTGPASSTNNHVAFFSGTSGKVIADSGLTLSGTNTGDETTTTIGSLINGATSKTTPVDADYLGLMDSAASNILKKLSWSNLKATLKTYFDTLYAPLSQPFDMHLMMPKTQVDASQVIYRGKLARAVTFPGNFSGSYFTGSANATASTVFDVQKNGSSIGSVTIAAGGVSATFATTSGASQSFSAGDIFSLIGPATADTTLANAAFTFTGTR